MHCTVSMWITQRLTASAGLFRESAQAGVVEGFETICGNWQVNGMQGACEFFFHCRMYSSVGHVDRILNPDKSLIDWTMNSTYRDVPVAGVCMDSEVHGSTTPRP